MFHSTSHRELRPPRFVDAPLLSLTVLLVGFSLVMVYSTTGVVSLEKYGDGFHFVRRQCFAAIIGCTLLYLASRIPVSKLKQYSPYAFVIAISALLLTFLPGLGHRAGGATRWINLGIVHFEPAELVKLMFIIFIAGYLSRHENKLEKFSYGVVKPIMFVGVVAGLLLLQPDFGSSSIIALVTLAMMLVSGTRLLHLVICGAGLSVAVGALVWTSPYRMARVVAFLSPLSDPKGKGYQLVQSLIAVASGQMGGVGLGSSQQKLFFLPAAHTDFIFAVISEELGFIGGLAIICCFLGIMWRGFRVAGHVATDSFSFVLAVGLTLLIVLPAFLNVGVVLGLLPTKGLVLPLVGYGGSSLVSSLITIGLLLGIAREYYKQRIR